MSPFRDHYNLLTVNSKNRDLSYFSHNSSIVAAAIARSLDRRDFALSTALLQNEGYSFDFAFVLSVRLVGGVK